VLTVLIAHDVNRVLTGC